MFRVSKMSGKAFAVDIGDVRDLDEDDLESIQALVQEGTPVIICEELDELAEIFGIDIDIEVI